MHRPDKAKHRRGAGIAETQVRVRAMQQSDKRQAVARLAKLKSQTLGELRARAQTTSHDSLHPSSGHIFHRHKFRARNFKNNSPKRIGVVLYRYVFFIFCGGLVACVVHRHGLTGCFNQDGFIRPIARSDASPGQGRAPKSSGVRGNPGEGESSARNQ